MALVYPILGDREWLYKLYTINQLSTESIARLVNTKCSCSSVRKALLRHKIPLRSVPIKAAERDDGFVINESVLTGCLLGDAWLRVAYKNRPRSYPKFGKGNKFLDHIEYVGGFLFPNTFKERISYSPVKINGRLFERYVLNGRVHASLIPWYAKWYPAQNGYKKVVPDDIKLDHVALLHWFMDDGYSCYLKKNPKRILLGFCSQSFSKEDQQRLCDEMWERFKIRANVVYCSTGTGKMIGVSQKDVGLFYDIVGKCSVASLTYKWKLPLKFGDSHE